MDAVGLRELYDHHAWSMDRIIARALEVPAAPAAPAAEATRPGAASLRDTLAHIVAAERDWLARWRSAERPFWYNPATVSEVEKQWTVAQVETRVFLAGLTGAETTRFLRMPLAFPDHVERVVARRRQTLAAAVVHVLLHAAQHRAEAAVLLSDFGRSPGELDYIDFLGHRETLLRRR